MSGVPRVLLEVFQEQIRKRVAFGSQAGTLTSVPPSSPLDEVETVYSCAVGVHSKTMNKDLTTLGRGTKL